MTAEERALRRAADMFHEIVAAHSAEKALARDRETGGRGMTAIMREKFQGSLRSTDKICEVAADGFELCIRALAELGATDVSIHECGEADLEAHW